jgi:hypothetical protein
MKYTIRIVGSTELGPRAHGNPHRYSVSVDIYDENHRVVAEGWITNEDFVLAIMHNHEVELRDATFYATFIKQGKKS